MWELVIVLTLYNPREIMKFLLLLLVLNLAHAADFKASNKSFVTLTDHDTITFPEDLKDGNGDGIITSSRKQKGFSVYNFSGGTQMVNSTNLKKVSGTYMD